MLRVDRSVLANSDIGAMVLNKDQAGAGFNRVAGVDGNFRFGNLGLGAYVVKTAASTSSASQAFKTARASRVCFA